MNKKTGKIKPTIEEVKKLSVAFTGRALFDLGSADLIYQEKGLPAYLDEMKRNRKKTLKPGPAFHLIQALANLKDPKTGENLVYLTMISQNHAEAGIRLLYSIKNHKLRIDRTAFTGGAEQVPYLKGLGADLFLSFSTNDVQQAVKAGIPAAHLVAAFQPNKETKQVRIAFDGDAVIFGDVADKLYKKKGLSEFLRSEQAKAHIPLPEGPFKHLLARINKIQAAFPTGKSPIRTALVTARGSSVLLRPLLTLEHWGLKIDEAVGLDGTNKAHALQAFAPHIFFDDHPKNITHASLVTVAGCVPSQSR